MIESKLSFSEVQKIRSTRQTGDVYKSFKAVKNDGSIYGNITAAEIAVIRRDIKSMFKASDGWSFRIYRQGPSGAGRYYDRVGRICVHIIKSPVAYEPRGVVCRTYSITPKYYERYELPLIDALERIISLRWKCVLREQKDKNNNPVNKKIPNKNGDMVAYEVYYPSFEYMIQIGHVDNGFVQNGYWDADKIKETGANVEKIMALSLLRE